MRRTFCKITHAMAKVSGPVLGISFTDDAVQAVVVRPTPAGDVQISTAVAAPLPPGVIENGEVRHVEALADALRKLLAANQIAVRNAVLGLPSRVVTTRTINIPPVPDKERSAVVRGEIEHLNALPPGTGAFDYVRLVSASSDGAPVASAKSSGHSVLFYAALRPTIETYRAAAQAAGLRVVGMEPWDFGAMRTAYPGLVAKPLALAISLGAYHTSLLFLQNGAPVYSRRLDVGIHQMLVPELSPTPTGQAGGWQMFDVEETSEIGSVPADPDLVAPGEANAEAMSNALFGDRIGKAGAARETLALEVGRSLEYFRREFRASLDELDIVLLPNNLDLAGLPVYMATALEQDVHFVYAFEHVAAGPGIPPHFLEEEGVAYAPALGLALGALGAGRFAAMPRFDLGVEDVAVVRARRAPRLLVGAAATSAALLILGTGLGALIRLRHAPVQQELRTVKSAEQVVNLREKALIAEQEQHQQLVYGIRAQNVPWTNVLHELGQAIIPGVGITNLSTTGADLSLSGQATDPSRVPDFWNRLSASGFFANVNLPTFSTAEGNRTTFQMRALLPPPPPPPPVPRSLQDLTSPAFTGTAAAAPAPSPASAPTPPTTSTATTAAAR